LHIIFCLQQLLDAALHTQTTDFQLISEKLFNVCSAAGAQCLVARVRHSDQQITTSSGEMEHVVAGVLDGHYC